jgi:hypothetical protein
VHTFTNAGVCDIRFLNAEQSAQFSLSRWMLFRFLNGSCNSLLMDSADIGGRRFRTAFVVILVVAVSALFVAITWPFLKALLLGALLAGLCHPLYRWITRLLRGRRSLGAIVTLVILFIVVAGPLSAFLGVVVQQALSTHTIGSCKDFRPWPITCQAKSNWSRASEQRRNPSEAS